MTDFEVRLEKRRIVERYPTGEIKHTESCGLVWVDEDAEPPDGYVYCPVSSLAPEAMEMNIRRKRP